MTDKIHIEGKPYFVLNPVRAQTISALIKSFSFIIIHVCFQHADLYSWWLNLIYLFNHGLLFWERDSFLI